MTTPTRTQTATSGFINWLYGLAEANDRARLAALRRGLMLEPTQLYELYRVIPPQFLDGISREEAERRLMLAALFAAHPLPFSKEEPQQRRRNLGESMRRLAERQRGSGSEEGDELPEPLKRRMDALLSAYSDEVFGHLQQIIRLLKSEEVPVDWEQLLWDLRNWNQPDRRVQWQWSRSFYVGHRQAEGGSRDVS